MQIDTSINTAYIRLTTFSSGGLRKFFRKSFKKIEAEKIENVVIDLENGGGNVGLSNKLTKYLAKTFKMAIRMV
jgi:C-terminal processing protease CtpA/Prc